MARWKLGEQWDTAGGSLPPWDGTGIPLPVGDDGWPVDPDAGEAPVLTALEPATAAITAPEFPGHVRGTGFTAESVIVWNGADEPTTFVDATDLWTTVVPSAVSAPTVLDVAVRNGSQTSNVLQFTWTAEPAPDDLAGWTKAELLAFAADHEPPIEVPSGATKAQIIALILAALTDPDEEN